LWLETASFRKWKGDRQWIDKLVLKENGTNYEQGELMEDIQECNAYTGSSNRCEGDIGRRGGIKDDITQAEESHWEDETICQQ